MLAVAERRDRSLAQDKAISFDGIRGRIRALGETLDADIERDIANLPKREHHRIATLNDCLITVAIGCSCRLMAVCCFRWFVP